MDKTEIILQTDGSFVERLVSERTLNAGQSVLDTLTENITRPIRNVFNVPGFALQQDLHGVMGKGRRMNARDSFKLLVRNLKLCPTLETTVNPKRLHETWSSFRRIDPEHGDDVTPALLVALILHDEEMFGELLNETDLAQLVTIARTALERYQLKIQPPNQPGKLLAASLKEQI